MNTVQHPYVRNVLRFFAISMIIIIIILMAGVATISVLLTGGTVDYSVVQGRLNLGEYTMAQKTIALNGEWAFFPNVFLQGEQANGNELENPVYYQLPTGKLSPAEAGGTYRLILSGGDWQNAALYIPNLKNPLQVYFDGSRVDSMSIESSERDFLYLNSIFPLDQALENTEEHELLITVNEGEGESALYKRQILLGTQGGIIMRAYVFSSNALMTLGFLSIIMLSGFIFMAMRPGHKMISLLTLFDTMLIFRIIFGMPEISTFFHTLWPQFHLSDRACLSLQLLFLMLGGIVGALLANHLFDPENRVPRYLTVPLPILFGVLAIVMPLNLGLFETMGIPIILTVYFLTFAVVFVQYVVYWKREKGLYAGFQIFKTTYVGLLIFFDIWMMNQKINFMALVYLYIIFFLAHTFIRLYDNNQSYQSVELLNQNLEKTVAERTAELTRANQILAELSTRDPLTGTHNRLYMENVMEQALASSTMESELLHLCMFDLDHFKRVNDLHGHDVGDEQLKYVVNLVSKRMNPNAVLARVGGEEFILFYEGLPSEDVIQDVEMLRRAIEEDAKRDPKHTTASFGLALYREGMTQKDLLKLADRCLYKAKNKGRNRVVYALTQEDEQQV